MNRYKIAGAALAVVLGLGLVVSGQPTIDEKVQERAEGLNARIEAREVQIDPAELLGLIHDNGVSLRIFDVRGEADYNLFHIQDAERVPLDRFRDERWVRSLPKQAAIVLVSNDEQRATEAWKMLAVQNVKNIYILEGGANYWLEVYGDPEVQVNRGDEPGPGGDGTFRYSFEFAMGGRQTGSDPDPEEAPPREFTKKFKRIGPPAKKSGGCG